MNIIRDKERIKKTGEVFTPNSLINEILDKLPPDVFSDSSKTFCDPACGDGRFLVEVLRRKLEAGHNLFEASATIYGVDLMPDNVELCKKQLRGILMDYMELSGKGRKLNGGINNNITRNIICTDSLKWDFINWKMGSEELQEEKNNELLGYL